MPIREIVLSTLLEKATIEIGILYTAPYKKKKKERRIWINTYKSWKTWTKNPNTSTANNFLPAPHKSDHEEETEHNFLKWIKQP